MASSRRINVPSCWHRFKTNVSLTDLQSGDVETIFFQYNLCSYLVEPTCGRGDGSHQKCDLVFAVGRETSHLCFRLYFVFVLSLRSYKAAASKGSHQLKQAPQVGGCANDLMIYCLYWLSLLNITKSLLTSTDSLVSVETSCDFLWLSSRMFLLTSTNFYWLRTEKKMGKKHSLNFLKSFVPGSPLLDEIDKHARWRSGRVPVTLKHLSQVKYIYPGPFRYPLVTHLD